MSMTQGNHEGGRMTDIVKGMVNVLMQSLTADGGEGADPEEAMRAALLWLADNVSDEMLEAADLIEAQAAEIEKLRKLLNAAEKDCHKARFALQTIGESTVPDQPESSGLTELEHVQHHNTQLRRIAIMTLRPEAIGIYEAPRRDYEEIRVRGVGRDLFEPRSVRVALTERPTDDEIRSIHNWMRGWKL